ncbi:hypothetical protein ACWC5G_37435, partial [Streptomyces sp. NPDC001274]
GAERGGALEADEAEHAQHHGEDDAVEGGTAQSMIWAGAVDGEALHPGVVPLVAPVLPLWPAAAVLIGLAPAVVAPAPPVMAGPRSKEVR